MNYLAHILLSGTDPGHRVGGLLGDFVKGPLKGERPLAVEQGIWLHRQLDVWVDQTSQFKQAQARLGSKHRRISGIALDLLFDHFLAANWASYSSIKLGDYTADFYRDMTQHHPVLPDSAKRWLDYSHQYDLLASYREFEILEAILARMDARRRRPLGLASVYAALAENYDGLTADFESLMPQSLSRAKALYQQMPQGFGEYR